MLKLSIISLAVAAGVAQCAVAATASAQGTWSGTYVGANLGFAYNKLTVNDRDYYDGLGDNSTQSFGGIGGVQAGHNWQLRGFVYGVEADVDALSNTKTDNNNLNDSGQPDAQIRSKVDAIGTVRGRVGVAVDPALIYLTAGLALVHSNDSYKDLETDSDHGTWTSNGLRPGLVFGAGTEVHVRANWSAKVEWLYYATAEKTVNFPYNNGNFIETNRQSFSNQGVIVRAGFNYMFR
jgi:outer membrane immunogenic protein